MSYNNALEYLESKLKEERTLIVESIIQGNMNEGEYRRLCGALQGLDLARNYIKDLAKRMDEE
jgi:hypothetical protein